PDPRFAVSAAGLVTRTGAGVLDEGWEELWVWSTNAHGTLRAPLDLYVDKPSSAATPRRFAIASPGVALIGRQDSMFANGKQMALAMLVK
ncbi:hypothetical protein Q0P22_14815, partial [Staphylococcus aureus]|nr:hypothetical protein [Staphylococcus aureus]